MVASMGSWGPDGLDPTVTLWPRGRGGGDYGTDLRGALDLPSLLPANPSRLALHAG